MHRWLVAGRKASETAGPVPDSRAGTGPTVRRGLTLLAALLILGPVTGGALSAPSVASVGGLPAPTNDPFYRYTGSVPLAKIHPGTILKTRTSTAHLLTVPTPVQMVQLLYRTQDALGRPTTTVASVLKPLVRLGEPRLLSYQSFYDSTTPRCEPSHVLRGGLDDPQSPAFTTETPIILGYLAQGYTVVTADFEGQTPAFATGTQYARPVLDAIRAATASPSVGLPRTVKVALLGYSGGAIASEWAAEYAPHYAPDVNRRLVGLAMGGVFADPLHNLSYVDGSTGWAPVIMLAFIGMSRAYQLDFQPYLNARGRALYVRMQSTCIFDQLFHYPLAPITFDSLVKPQFALGDFAKDGLPRNALGRVVARVANKLIMGTEGTPTVPIYIRMGTAGQLEGTRPSRLYGSGDGVMIDGDVRTLARGYCSKGLTVDYDQVPMSHIPEGALMLAQAAPWLSERFNGKTAPSNCDSIAPGNSLAPAVLAPQAPKDRDRATHGGDVHPGTARAPSSSIDQHAAISLDRHATGDPSPESGTAAGNTRPRVNSDDHRAANRGPGATSDTESAMANSRGRIAATSAGGAFVAAFLGTIGLLLAAGRRRGIRRGRVRHR